MKTKKEKKESDCWYERNKTENPTYLSTSAEVLKLNVYDSPRPSNSSSKCGIKEAGL